MVCPHRTEIERRGGERNGYRCLSSVSWHLVFGEEDGWDGCGCTSAETSQGLSSTSTLPLPSSCSNQQQLHAFYKND
jgi:hypothetical protein